MSKLKQKIGAGVIAVALMSAVPFIVDLEGESLEAYQDVVGVWTICHGETLGVKPGDRRTREECQALTESRVGQFMEKVAGQIEVNISPKTLAAHTSFAYNIGINGYKSSKALELTNEGKLAEGCRAMKNWNGLTIKGVKYNCNKPQPEWVRRQGCDGIVNRRNEEIKLCLSGLE